MSSAFIPDGLLPDTSDKTRYTCEYIRLRRIYDPKYRESVRERRREEQRRYRKNKKEKNAA